MDLSMILPPLLVRLLMDLSMILPIILSLSFASSSLAAVIQICRSVGMCSRALFSTRRAFSYVSNLASAIHSSVLVGQHSTARLNKILASLGVSSSMAAFHSLTELGICSSALRNTFFLARGSCSRSAALIQILTVWGTCSTASFTTFLASSGGCSLAASSQTSSDLGQTSQPLMMRFLAAWILPVTSSSLAEAIHAGGWLGLVSLTDLSNSRAFLMSLMSPP